MNTIIEKIRAEVNRLKEEYYPGRNMTENIVQGAFNRLLSRLSDLEKEEKPSEVLEEEIQKYMSERWEFGCINPTTPVYLYDFTTDELKECARHFAKWQKEQMMDEWLKDRDGCFWDGVAEGKKAMEKEAVEGEVFQSHFFKDSHIFVQSDYLPIGQFKAGDKVKLIIVKED